MTTIKEPTPPQSSIIAASDFKETNEPEAQTNKNDNSDDAIAKEFESYLTTIASAYAKPLEEAIGERERELELRIDTEIEILNRYKNKMIQELESAKNQSREQMESIASKLDSSVLSFKGKVINTSDDIQKRTDEAFQSFVLYRTEIGKEAKLLPKRLDDTVSNIIVRMAKTEEGLLSNVKNQTDRMKFTFRLLIGALGVHILLIIAIGYFFLSNIG